MHTIRMIDHTDLIVESDNFCENLTKSFLHINIKTRQQEIENKEKTLKEKNKNYC